jgi:hypothetical protein
MVRAISELELSCLDHLPRQDLLHAVRARAGDLPSDLLRRLEEQPTDRLRLLLLAGRLIQVLRHARTPCRCAPEHPVPAGPV